jgi:hypothetical protein
MIPNSILTALECSLTKNHAYRHFIVEPITLNCGHSACKRCILKTTQPTKCLQCGNINEIDVSRVGESFIVKCVVNSYIRDLFSISLTEIKKTFESFKRK